MGKSAAGAVWLDGEHLAPFDFWQFWRNVDDRDVIRFLTLFTELPSIGVQRVFRGGRNPGALPTAVVAQARVDSGVT